MPRVTIDWLVGRTQKQRDIIAKEITETIVNNASVKPDQVTVVFKETPPEHQYKGGVNYKPIN